MIDVRATLAALAEPTRLAIYGQLLEAPMTATRLEPQYPMTRQALSKHLEALVAVGLARSERVGRERFYTAKPEPARDLACWLRELVGDPS